MTFPLQVQGFLALGAEIQLEAGALRGPCSKWVALGDWVESLLAQHGGEFQRRPEKDDVCFDLVFETLRGRDAFRREYAERLTPRFCETPDSVSATKQEGPSPAMEQLLKKSIAMQMLEEKRQAHCSRRAAYVLSGHSELARSYEVRANALSRKMELVEASLRHVLEPKSQEVRKGGT